MQYRLSMIVRVNVVLNQGMLLSVTEPDVSTTRAVVIFRVMMPLAIKTLNFIGCVSIRAAALILN